jgi:hypothetical protein
MRLLKLWFVVKVNKAVRADSAKEGVGDVFCPFEVQPLFDSIVKEVNGNPSRKTPFPP